MKAQNTNETMLKSAAHDQAWAVVELIESGMDIDEAVEAQAEGWMNDPYDEDEYDAPYDVEQVKPIIKAAVLEHMENYA